MTALRLGHLIKGLGRGGAESLLPQTIRASAGPYTHHVAYGLPWKDALVDELRGIAGTVECFGARGSLGVLAHSGWVRRWIKKHQLDLVHCHLPLTGAIGRLGARGTGIPVVYTEHNLQTRYRLPTRMVNRATWGLQDQVVAVSEEVRASIERHLGSSVPVEVIHNGIEDVEYSPTAVDRVREELNIPRGVQVVGTVAVFRVQKRLDHWLEAAARVLDLLPDTYFVLVGDGPLREMLEDRTRELGLTDRVVFTGLREEVSPYLGLFDVFMVSSEFEGLPLAVLEAMSAGVPVVATRAGGIPEIIDDGLTGRLVPVGAVTDLADAAAAVLGDPSSIGDNGRRRVRREFGIDRMVQNLESLYERLVSRR